MKFLAVLFISPVYFMMRGMWGGFALNLVFYTLAWLTIFIFGLGIFFWFLAVVHAAWNLRTELMEEQATIMAKKMAEEMRRPESQSGGERA